MLKLLGGIAFQALPFDLGDIDRLSFKAVSLGMRTPRLTFEPASIAQIRAEVRFQIELL